MNSFQVERILVFALLSAVVVGFIICMPNQFALNDDAAIYLGTAEHLFSSGNYEFNYRPQTRFPPSVPVLIALSLFGLNIAAAASLLMWLSLLIFFWGSYLIIRRYFDSFRSVLLTLVIAFSAPFITLASESLCSDLPYAAISVLCIHLLSSLVESEQRNSASIFMLAILLAMAVMTRSVGVSLLAASAASLMFLVPFPRRMINCLVACGPAILSEVIWRVWVKVNRTPDYIGEYMDSYTSQMMLLDPHRPLLGPVNVGSLLQRFANRMFGEITHATEAILRIPWLEQSYHSFVTVTFIALIGLGVYSVWKSSKAVLLYLMLYLSVYGLWPFDEQLRFIAPVLPFILIYFAGGLQALCENLCIRTVISLLRSRFFGLAVLVMLISSLYYSTGGRQSILSTLSWGGMAIVVLMARRLDCGLWDYSRINLVLCQLKPYLLNCLFTILVIVGFMQVILPSTKKLHGGMHVPSMEASEWLKNNASIADITAAEQLSLIHYLSNRKVIFFPVSDDVEFFDNFIIGKGVRYIVAVDDPVPYYYPDQAERIHTIRQSTSIRIYERASGSRWKIYEVVS